ncbi:MAG: DUF4331 family protein, partial [Gammaproteobacteria bacterium]
MLAIGIASITLIVGLPSSRAADHGDGPLVSVNRSGDLGDVFAFLDPNDNTRLVVAMTVQGFIVPGEAVNFSVFDHQLIYRFAFETTGNARPDRAISVRFTRKGLAPGSKGSDAQTAIITLPNGTTFTAPTSVSNLSGTSPAPVVTTDPTSGVGFFAGEVDDPFPFDIPGFSRFVTSVLGGAPDPTQLNRGRDSFAGYDTLAIALSIPLAQLGTLANNEVGVSATTLSRTRVFRAVRRGKRCLLRGNRFREVQEDRAGVPAVNVALI